MNVTTAANEAIFINQLTTSRAIKFVASAARVDRKTAEAAVKQCMISYKNKAAA